MKSVKALLFAMVISLTVLAGCSGKPDEVPADDTAKDVPAKEITVPASVPTTATVTEEGADATTDTTVDAEETTTDDAGVPVTDAGDVDTEETAQ